ncbi:MAG: hydrogenase iron-sulfur subunit [Candidatus Lokiarchaeota archaeon]|nr:hydrogenase iron-sulfur subunit [Candidatus Lokiarchaeota archaeon]
MNKDLKIKVFACTCKDTLDTLDFNFLENSIKNLLKIEFETLDFLCSKDGLEKIANFLKEPNNRAVIASCTPQKLEMVVQDFLRDKKISPYHFDIANIREQVAWVSNNKEKATKKAIALIKASVNKIKYSENIEIKQMEINSYVCIIGGGISGLQAALDIHSIGLNPIIIEKEEKLGGRVNNISNVFPYNMNGKTIINELIKEINKNNIEFHLEKNVEWIDGTFPKFKIKLEDQEKPLVCSNIIIATGHDIYKPYDMLQFRYLEENIITLEELSKLILKSNGSLRNPKNDEVLKNILMIQCIGSRDENHFKYCSAYCCNSAINHAIELKEKYKDLNITISYFDLRTPFLDELTYQKARNLGINFIRGKVAEIFNENEYLISKIYDTIANQFLLLKNDLVVLSTALIPNQNNKELLKFLQVELTEDGFVKELYDKLRRVEVNRKGIYVCGTVSGPKTILKCKSESNAVALKVYQDHLELNLSKELTITKIDKDKCNGCGLCVEICPFKIPILYEIEKDQFKAEIDEMLCKGCGICAGICPTAAAQLKVMNKNQLISQIDAILEDSNDENIMLGITCYECAYSTIDSIGMLKWKYSENLRLLNVPCIGRVSFLDLLYALDKGAKQILLFSCAEDRCHYLKGNVKATLEVLVLKELLKEIGWNEDIIEIFPLYSAEPEKFMQAVSMMIKRLERDNEEGRI